MEGYSPLANPPKSATDIGYYITWQQQSMLYRRHTNVYEYSCAACVHVTLSYQSKGVAVHVVFM